MYSHIGGEHTALDHLGAFEKGCSVAQSFLCCPIGAIFGDIGKLEEFVRCGDDILDFAARPGLEQGQGVDKNGRIRDQFGSLFELRQGNAGRYAAFQDVDRFD